MKKTFFKSILFAGMLLGTMASCSDVEDLYNPELVREKAKKALGLDIAADQDWNMTSVVTANFTLTEDALSDYSFRIYSANPTTNSNAVILANYDITTDANGKASASFKFEMPSYLDYVYVARVDDHGRRMIGIANIENGAISKAFGENVSASTKAVTDYELPTITSPYTEEEVNTLLADAYDLTLGLTNGEGFKGMDGETGKTVAKIAGEGVVCNYTKGFEASGSYTLIIADGATWEIPDNGGNFQISNVDIIVANGGTLKFTGMIQMSGNTRLIIMEGGVVDNTTSSTSNENININGSGCMIYNAGTFNANKVYADNGAALLNATTGIWKTNTTKCAGGTGWENFINWGKIDSEEIISNGDQGTLYNACLIRADKLTVDQISVKENSAIEVPIIDCNKIYLRENSIVRATTVAPSQQISVNYIGTEGGKALFSAQTWELKNAPSNIDSNNVYIEMEIFSLHGKTPEEDPWYTLQIYNQYFPNGKFPIGEAPLIISAENTDNIEDADCIGKGNTPKDEVIEELLGSTFTYAFEDLNKEVGDYDMNDVVLKCTGPKDGKITIKLAAVGAEKNLFIYFNNKQTNQQIALFNGKEAHAALGVAEGVITNTGMGDNVPTIEEIISVDSGFLFTVHCDIYVVDEQGRESHIPNFDKSFVSGDAPYGICVPCDWKYPQEYVSIIKAYPAFADWAGDINEQDWYTQADESKIY